MSPLVYLALFAAVAATTANTVSLHEDSEWNAFKKSFLKTYENSAEEMKRRDIFLQNLRLIEDLNQQNNGFGVEMNEFGDLTHEEFASQRLGKIQGSPNGKFHRQGAAFLFPENENANELPAQVDWRKEGFVTAVKNQGQCGSCWSFSTTGSLEGQHFRATGKLVSLSEQNLVDCSTEEGDMGCNGGLMSDAFSYVAINGGIMSEADYPYKATKGNCSYDASKKVAEDVGWVRIPQQNETALKQASATIGPISVAIDAAHQSFQFYSSGVYYEASCSTTQLDHGVLVVGYGTENGKDYWLVKNSWGAQWGQQGFIKMSRNQQNNCGIASMASYPIV